MMSSSLTVTVVPANAFLPSLHFYHLQQIANKYEIKLISLYGIPAPGDGEKTILVGLVMQQFGKWQPLVWHFTIWLMMEMKGLRNLGSLEQPDTT